MHSQSASLDTSLSISDSFAALRFGSDAAPLDGVLDLRALSRSVSQDPSRFAHEFMSSVSSTLDEVEDALAGGENHKLGELGSRLKVFSKMAAALGLGALCDVLACVQLRAPVNQTCDMT